MPIAATSTAAAPTTPQARRIRQLERDLEEARRIGRWLSDDERAQRALEQQRLQEELQEQRQQRRKLLAVLVVSLLLPPLWPLAIALTLYLLFPATTLRLAVATGVSLLALGGLLAVLITTLVVALLALLL
ncbi:MAG: hypothetical protein KFB97_06585 [Cyanobium sp. M30B3]|jgi:hypothetical protein|nr:MAG: hypothetical protein KFB97_06585 [Cyanobium sp. M30B3]